MLPAQISAELQVRNQLNDGGRQLFTLKPLLHHNGTPEMPHIVRHQMARNHAISAQCGAYTGCQCGGLTRPAPRSYTLCLFWYLPFGQCGEIPISASFTFVVTRLDANHWIRARQDKECADKLIYGLGNPTSSLPQRTNVQSIIGLGTYLEIDAIAEIPTETVDYAL